MAENRTSAQRLRQFLNSKIKGKFVTALLNAIGAGDDFNQENILAVKDQLFIATATGDFLERLLAGMGIVKPQGVGIDDDLLRNFAIKQTNSKLVSNIFLEVLEVFYGEDAVRANVLSSVPEKYPLVDGMTLVIKVDTIEKPLTVVFSSEDFTNINLATAQEVATAISNSAFGQGYSLTSSAQLNSENGLTYVQLLSGTKGPKSSITIIGGQAQNILKFPQQKDGIPKIGTEFTMSFNDQFVRFTWSGGQDPGIQFLDSGDYVNIYGNQFLENNKGYFTIENVQGGPVGSAYFEILNPIFKPQSPVILTGQNAQSGNGTVRRSLNITDAPTGAVRSSGVVTITTIDAHQFSPGQEVLIQNIANTSFNGTFIIASTPTANTFTYAQAGNDATSGSGEIIHSAIIDVPTTGAIRNAGVVTITTTLTHGFLVGQNVEVLGVEDATFNGLITIVSVGASTLTYTQNFSNDLVFFKPVRNYIQKLPRYATIYEVNPYELVVFLPATTRIVKRQLIGSAHLHEDFRDQSWNGPYLYDPQQGLPISKTATPLTEAIQVGQLKTVGFGTNTSDFPDEEGFLMFDFATDNQEGPVRYYGRPSSGSWLLDPSYKFKKSHAIGADVSLLLDRKAYQPRQDGTDYQAFLTDTVVGRIEAQKLIEQLAASGVFISIIITYPKGPGLEDLENYVYAGDLSTLGND